MTEISFTVYGSPIPQPRTRARAMRRRDGRVVAHVYNPSNANEWKRDIQLEAMNHLSNVYLRGPVRMVLRFYFLPPKSLKKKHVPGYSIPIITKPDVDNLFKAVADALTGILFKDDAQIYDAQILKGYVGEGQRARVEVTLWGED